MPRLASLPLPALLLAVPLLRPLPGAAQQAGWRPDPERVRALSARGDANYDESKVGAYSLPDPLTTRSGARVTTPAAWRARREELLELFRENVYGRSPGRPERLGFRVVRQEPRAMGRAATLRRVEIVSGVGEREHQFGLTLFLPNDRRGPVPVFLLLNNRGPEVVDPTRAQRSGFWPAEAVIARGYGIAALQVGDLAPDDRAHYREGVIRLFEATDAGPRAGDAWGALGAWAWGASRAMDYLETDPGVDPARVAVLGHSRGGKAALWAGAQDERFALVISNESGEGGAALSRRDYGERLARIDSVYGYWFAGNYRRWAGREAEMPTDQHELLSLVAPRPLYVASADQDLWSDPRGEFLSLAATSPVFALWGDPPLGVDAMPPLDRPVLSGRRAYHVRTGGHDLTAWDWARYLDFADRRWGPRRR